MQPAVLRCWLLGCRVIIANNVGFGRRENRAGMGVRLFFVLCEGEVKMDDCGQPPEDACGQPGIEPWNL